MGRGWAVVGGVLLSAQFSCTGGISSGEPMPLGTGTDASTFFDGDVWEDSGGRPSGCALDCVSPSGTCQQEVHSGYPADYRGQCVDGGDGAACVYDETMLVFTDCALQGLRCHPDGCRKAPWDEIGDWLTYMNRYRTAVGIAEVTEDPAKSSALVKHSKYAVRNQQTGHDETPGKPLYTVEGQMAAQTSNLAYSSAEQDFRWSIDLWLTAPFHGVGVLRQQLKSSGYGEHFDAQASGLRYASGLNVLQDIDRSRLKKYPLAWPPDGFEVHLTKFISEYPDPLTSCPGYVAPTGLPIYVMLGGTTAPRNVSATLKVNSVDEDVCVFDETNFVGNDAQAQDTGRSILAGDHVVVLMPRTPLPPNANIEYEVFANGSSLKRTFRTGFIVR